jgi:Na+-driven multidrug efflux pump
MITTLSFLHFHCHLVDLSRPSWREVLDSWRRILQVGLSAAATQLITPLSRSILTKIAAIAGGTMGVAAFAAASRIESFLFIIGMAFSIALMPIMGQSWGAERFRRVNLARRYANRVALRYGLISWVACLALAWWVARWFSHEPQVIRWTTHYLWIVTLGHVGMHASLWTSASLSAVGKAGWGAMIGILTNLILTAPGAYLGQRLYGYTGMLIGMALGLLLGGLAAVVLGRELLPGQTGKAPIHEQ